LRADFVWAIGAGFTFALAGVTLMWTAIGSGFWGGVVLAVTGLLILAITLVALRQYERRREDQFSHSLAVTVEGAFRRLTYDGFMRLPANERTALLSYTPIEKWFKNETSRAASNSLKFYQSPAGRATLLSRRIGGRLRKLFSGS
jgi:hypothetical protein